MKSLLVLLAVTFLGSGLTACGNVGKGAGSAARVSAIPKSDGSTSTRSFDVPQRLSGFRGDEDDDDEAGETSRDNRNDNDVDFDNDVKDKRLGYIDRDDRSVLGFGHRASPALERSFEAFAVRYYAAAAAEDGAGACAMIAPRLVKAIPEEYGEGAGPPYMRGRTCSAVMSGLFKHIHDQVAAHVTVTGVRVKGRMALVLLGSEAFPASFLAVERQAGVWRLAELIGAPWP